MYSLTELIFLPFKYAYKILASTLVKTNRMITPNNQMFLLLTYFFLFNTS